MPMYGFTPEKIEYSMKKSRRFGAAVNIGALIEDFLRKQEKGGGPTVAVSVVIDAVQTSNLRSERGFVLNDVWNEPTKAENLTSSESILAKWPAVYMRSSSHLSNKRALANPMVSPGSGILGGIRRSSSKHIRQRRTSRSHEDDPSSTKTTSSNMMKSWSTDNSPPMTPVSPTRSAPSSRSIGRATRPRRRKRLWPGTGSTRDDLQAEAPRTAT